ncbi:MAG: c-type cytochrome, partial [Actinomycetota bacterium]
LEYPVVITVPTAGITERTGFSIPAWLGTLLLLVPAFGLIYLALGSGAAECGQGTALAADRVTGVAENCDGTAFEGRGPAGGAGADFIAMGETVYAECAGCHGPQGQGQGNFPALTGVLTTFSSCTDHIEWVSLGSNGFRAEGNSTYGDTGKAIAGGMPSFGGSLSEEQLASVVAFERVRHAGANPEEVLADCGLVEGEDAEGEEGSEGDGEEGGEEGDTTDTTGAPDGTTPTTAPTEAAAG